MHIYQAHLSLFFHIEAIYQIATDLSFQSPTDILTLYGIFGGMPRYYEIMESNRTRSPHHRATLENKKSRYKIRDPFITFWMRFIYRQLSIYESGNFPYFLNRLDTYISEFMGFAFENITRELLIQRNHHNAAPFYFHRIGRWWDRQSEIDLVALNPETRQTLNDNPGSSRLHALSRRPVYLINLFERPLSIASDVLSLELVGPDLRASAFR